MSLLLRFWPYLAIAALSGLLLLAKARIDTLDARLDAQRSEFNAQIADGVADAARVAIRETDRAVKREREKWKALIAKSNDAAAAAERERRASDERARALAAELETLYRSDPDAESWASARIPDAVLDRLRH